MENPGSMTVPGSKKPCGGPDQEMRKKETRARTTAIKLCSIGLDVKQSKIKKGDVISSKCTKSDFKKNDLLVTRVYTTLARRLRPRHVTGFNRDLTPYDE